MGAQIDRIIWVPWEYEYLFLDKDGYILTTVLYYTVDREWVLSIEHGRLGGNMYFWPNAHERIPLQEQLASHEEYVLEDRRTWLEVLVVTGYPKSTVLRWLGK